MINYNFVLNNFHKYKLINNNNNNNKLININ